MEEKESLKKTPPLIKKENKDPHPPEPENQSEEEVELIRNVNQVNSLGWRNAIAENLKYGSPFIVSRTAVGSYWLITSLILASQGEEALAAGPFYDNHCLHRDRDH